MTRPRRLAVAVGLLVGLAAAAGTALSEARPDTSARVAEPRPAATAGAPAVEATQTRPDIAGADDAWLLQRRHLAHRDRHHQQGHTHHHAPAGTSPVDAAAVRAADDTAVDLVLAYTTRRWDEPAEQRGARLAPMLTEHAQSLLATGSSGAAETADQARRREHTTAQLIASEPLTVQADTAAFLVTVDVTVTDRTGSTATQRTYQVTLTHTGGRWLVDDLRPA